MIRVGCKCACGLVWFACALALTGVIGCSEPGAGTAQVAAEARQRMLPQASPKASSSKGAATGKKFSIKDRAPAAPEAPEK